MPCPGSPRGRTGIRRQICLTAGPSPPSHCHRGPAHPVRSVGHSHLPLARPGPSNTSPEGSRGGGGVPLPVPLRVCESMGTGGGGLTHRGEGVFLSHWESGPPGARSVLRIPPPPALLVGLYLCFTPARPVPIPADLPRISIRGPRAPPADRCSACTSTASRSPRASVQRGGAMGSSPTPRNHRGVRSWIEGGLPATRSKGTGAQNSQMHPPGPGTLLQAPWSIFRGIGGLSLERGG